jgi:hypothetical protein
MSSSVTIDDIVKTYVSLRTKKDAIEAETKAKLADIAEKMDKLETWIQLKADELGVTSFKTPHGTAFTVTKDFAQVADWDATLKFIRDEDAYDLLEKRVSKIAVRGYIEKNREVPPGINYGTKIEVQIRKPTKRDFGGSSD